MGEAAKGASALSIHPHGHSRPLTAAESVGSAAQPSVAHGESQQKVWVWPAERLARELPGISRVGGGPAGGGGVAVRPGAACEILRHHRGGCGAASTSKWESQLSAVSSRLPL